MKILAVVAFAAVVASSAHAGTISINFDDFPNPGQVQLIGDYYNGVGGPSLGVSTTGLIDAGGPFSFPTAHESFYGSGTITTSFAFTAVSFDVLQSTGTHRAFTFRVLDQNLTMPTAGGELGSQENIYHVTLNPSQPSYHILLDNLAGESFILDNLVFTTSDGGGIPTHGSDAPEPAEWALLLLGFGLTGAAIRRRAAAKEAA